MWRFIAADLKRSWAGVLAVLLLVAFASALGVAVTLQERALRLGSARAAAAFDLVVGAPGSETQLVLSAVFLQAAPLTLMPGSVLAGLTADPRVAWAAPVGFGDFVQDYPIVGTTQKLIDGMGGLTEGASFANLDEAVVGAAVAFAPGDTFHPMHGQVHGAGEVHAAITYRVVGRMKPTGTAWDRAVLVPIEAVWRVHGHEAHEHEGHEHEGHEHEAGEAAGAAHDSDEAHEGESALDAPVNPQALNEADAPGVPAIVVKPKTIADAYRLRQRYRNEQTLAVFPGEVLTRLYGTLGDARLVLAMLAAGVQALVGAAVLLVIVLHVLQRRRQIGALRAFGAPRPVVFAIVWLETFLISAAGLIAGFALGFVAAKVVSRMISAQSGVVLPVNFVPGDVALFALLLGVSGLIALIPAVLAYRQSPAAALRA